MINNKVLANKKAKETMKTELGTVFHIESKYKDMAKLKNLIAELIFSNLKTELIST